MIKISKIRQGHRLRIVQWGKTIKQDPEFA